MSGASSDRSCRAAHPAVDERRLLLTGAHNLRYVSGTTATGRKIAPRLLWRSNALNSLDDEGRRALRREQIRTIIDLREDDQRERFPDAIQGVGANLVSIPLFAGLLPGIEELGAEACRVGDLMPIYEHLVVTCGLRIAASIAQLAAPRALPGIVHCTSGKDRTGVVVALLLDALGVARDDILRDFLLSARYGRADFTARADRLFDLGPRARGVEPAWLECVLTYADDKHGGAAGYLVDNGLEPNALARLRRTLVV